MANGRCVVVQEARRSVVSVPRPCFKPVYVAPNVYLPRSVSNLAPALAASASQAKHLWYKHRFSNYYLSNGAQVRDASVVVAERSDGWYVTVAY